MRLRLVPSNHRFFFSGGNHVKKQQKLLAYLLPLKKHVVPAGFTSKVSLKTIYVVVIEFRNFKFWKGNLRTSLKVSKFFDNFCSFSMMQFSLSQETDYITLFRSTSFIKFIKKKVQALCKERKERVHLPQACKYFKEGEP